MKLDLTHITEKHFWDFEDPDVINSGWCYVWAWLAHQYYGGQLMSFDGVRRYDDRTLLDGHAFIKIGNLYYDSSRPLGVHEIGRLDFFDECAFFDRDVWDQDPQEFKRYWTSHGSEMNWIGQRLRPWQRIKIRPRSAISR